MHIEAGTTGRHRLDRIGVERIVGADAHSSVNEALGIAECLALRGLIGIGDMRLMTAAIAARVRHGMALPLMRIAASELRRGTAVTAAPSEPSAWSGSQVSPAGNGIATAVESA